MDRDYNLGSGYSFKILPGISWRDIGSLRLGVERIQLYKNLELNLSQAYYLRHSHYAYFPDVHYEAIESKIGLLYRFK
jgi:hypothetical protein